MRRARVVIGAGYGDEGKGLITDFHAAAAGGDGLVVRFNGGAQAGHTVVSPEGVRHVFSHFGSGTLAGARTYLSRFFVVNPLLFFKERAVLDRKAPRRRPLLVDRSCPVTTPWDMLINQLVEESRGAARHGSCGVGFGETLERSLQGEHALRVADLADRARLLRTLRSIRDVYLPKRLAALGLAGIRDERIELLGGDAALERFARDALEFATAVELCDTGAMRRASSIVFEGAQGLLLDQHRGHFPYVTRSSTGLCNVLTLAAECGLDRLDVTYVTRAYVTRHGAGPLAHALPGAPYPGVRDETNRPNAYQGCLRFAHPDLDILASAIADDLSDGRAHPGVGLRHDLAITCLDQTGGRVRLVKGGTPLALGTDAFVAALASAAGATLVLGSSGPSRIDVETLEMRPAGLHRPAGRVARTALPAA